MKEAKAKQSKGKEKDKKKKKKFLMLRRCTTFRILQNFTIIFLRTQHYSYDDLLRFPRNAFPKLNKKKIKIKILLWKKTSTIFVSK